MSTSLGKLFVATGNKGKLKELIEGVELFFPNVFDSVEGIAPKDAEETEKTFEGNARIKSNALVRHLVAAGLEDFYVIADDSGLEVDELNGEPGIYSARYAGDHVEPELHIEKLITELKAKNIADKKAHCRYVCAIDLVQVTGKKVGAEHTTRGTCEGSITYTRAGDSGFGYDPVFWLKKRNKTMAELSSAEKNKISHRWDAFEKLKKLLKY